MKIRDILNKDTATISFEVFPPKKSTDFGNVEAAALGIAALQPAYMSVTYGAGGSTKGHTIALAGEIQKQHNVPTVAHLTCVCADRSSIGAALTEMQAAGIENILALRGDIPKDFDGEVFTDFTHASDLVRFIKENGDFCVGGACYPEVHPESKNRVEDLEHLKQKVDCGVDFLTTQMFFDNTVFYNFREMCAIKGIDVPLIAGIMPITKASQLERTVKLSGCSLPTKFVKIVERFGDRDDAMQQAGIVYAAEQIIDLMANGVDHIHIYTMNKPDVAGAIVRELGSIIHE